jgi:hypothetical protein
MNGREWKALKENASSESILTRCLKFSKMPEMVFNSSATSSSHSSPHFSPTTFWI